MVSAELWRAALPLLLPWLGGVELLHARAASRACRALTQRLHDARRAPLRLVMMPQNLCSFCDCTSHAKCAENLAGYHEGWLACAACATIMRYSLAHFDSGSRALPSCGWGSGLPVDVRFYRQRIGAMQRATMVRTFFQFLFCKGDAELYVGCSWDGGQLARAVRLSNLIVHNRAVFGYAPAPLLLAATHHARARARWAACLRAEYQRANEFFAWLCAYHATTPPHKRFPVAVLQVLFLQWRACPL